MPRQGEGGVQGLLPRLQRAQASRWKRLDRTGHAHTRRCAPVRSSGRARVRRADLAAEQLARYFPDIEGVRLLDKQVTHTTELFPGKVSVVVFSSFQSSEVRLALPSLLCSINLGVRTQEHINSFVRPTLADLSSSPHFQYIYVRPSHPPRTSPLLTCPVADQPAREPAQRVPGRHVPQVAAQKNSKGAAAELPALAPEPRVPARADGHGQQARRVRVSRRCAVEDSVSPSFGSGSWRRG